MKKILTMAILTVVLNAKMITTHQLAKELGVEPHIVSNAVKKIMLDSPLLNMLNPHTQLSKDGLTVSIDETMVKEVKDAIRR